MKPLYSFVIPVYNTSPDYLDQCVNSCLTQTKASIEVILVDDGSKEVCSVHCDQLSEIDDRIRIVHQTNAGVSIARNRGINEATGDWVICVDSDDWVDDKLCETIAEVEKKDHEIDFVLFSLMREYEAKSVPISGMYENGKTFTDAEALAQLQRDVLEHPLQNNILVFPYCKAIRREVLLRAQPVFPDGVAMCEDVVSAFKLFGYVNKGVYLDLPLYHYRQAAESAVYMYRNAADKEQQELLRILAEMIKEKPSPETYLKGYNREVLYAAQRAFSQKIYHKNSSFTLLQKRKDCYRLFQQEPFRSGLRDVDVNGLSRNHKLKCFLLRNKMYELCAVLYRISYTLLNRHQ